VELEGVQSNVSIEVNDLNDNAAYENASAMANGKQALVVGT
jgi:hypothetical protein